MTDGSLPAQFDQLRAGSGSWKIAGLTECRYHLATTPICRNLNSHSQANSVVIRVAMGSNSTRTGLIWCMETLSQCNKGINKEQLC